MSLNKVHPDSRGQNSDSSLPWNHQKLQAIHGFPALLHSETTNSRKKAQLEGTATSVPSQKPTSFWTTAERKGKTAKCSGVKQEIVATVCGLFPDSRTGWRGLDTHSWSHRNYDMVNEGSQNPGDQQVGMDRQKHLLLSAGLALQPWDSPTANRLDPNHTYVHYSSSSPQVGVTRETSPRLAHHQPKLT